MSCDAHDDLPPNRATDNTATINLVPTTARPAAGTWAAYPFPSSIILYQPGQGYVKFDQAKADQYFAAVVEKMAKLIGETIQKWDQAGLFR